MCIGVCFAICDVETTEYEFNDRKQWHTNHPVNLNHCKYIERKRLYDGYAISFEGTGVTWLFIDQQTRDDHYKRILGVTKI